MPARPVKVITPAAVLVAMNDWRTRRRACSLARRLAAHLGHADRVVFTFAPAARQGGD